MIERSLVEIAKTKLSAITAKLPTAAKFKYLPITNQLLIYCESNKNFKQKEVEEIAKMLPDSENSSAKTGYWRSTNFLLINNFAEDFALKNHANDILALKVLTTYAQKKEKAHIDSEISWEAHTAFYDSYGNMEYANEIEKALRKNDAVTSAGLIKQIKDLKKCDKAEQRFLLYTTLNIFHEALSFENTVTAGAVEFLLNQLPEIDEHTISFSQIQNMNIEYPKDIMVSPAMLYQLKNPFTTFSKTTSLTDQEDNYLNIVDLNLTITEFNEKYKDQYRIKKGEGITWKGFWLVLDKDNKECGVLMLEDNELKETQYSENTYHWLEKIQQPMQRIKDNHLNIAALNLTIAEFNEKYKDQYRIKKGEGIVWKGFWLVIDKENKECGVLMLENKELKETPHSEKTNHCLENIRQMSMRRSLS